MLESTNRSRLTRPPLLDVLYLTFCLVYWGQVSIISHMTNTTLIESIENSVNDDDASILALLNLENTNAEIIDEFQQNNLVKFGDEDED